MSDETWKLGPVTEKLLLTAKSQGHSPSNECGVKPNQPSYVTDPRGSRRNYMNPKSFLSIMHSETMLPEKREKTSKSLSV